ncbi:MAG: hydrogenase formation protein HypD [Chloroflexi bacterium]|nr:hydrogenase formation protein HypD [Chloroflexota bacterium]
MNTELFVDRFRDPAAARAVAEAIRARSTRPIRLMEFCGGHTHAILRFGIPDLLPPTVELRSGPGCPVCVTAAVDLDRAIALAQVEDVILTTFGDMIRVPGSKGGGWHDDSATRNADAKNSTIRNIPATLAQAKAEGDDVRVVYSPLDALHIARENPDRPVIFLGVGFETTAPMVGSAVLAAESEGLENFYAYSTHKLTPPATHAILGAGEVQLSGIIGPGHVTTVIGSDAWRFLPDDYGIPCAVAGFEPLDILRAILALVEMVETNQPDVNNTYARSVRPEGNAVAQRVLDQVFEIADTEWRGFGTVPASGLRLREAYARFDAAQVFPVEVVPAHEPPGCRCGEILRGVFLPTECPLFGKVCTPQMPIGPCMVSAEGACAAYYRYGTRDVI